MTYPVKVQALLDGTPLDPAEWTQVDYLDLALAALDQAGASVSLQRRVHKLASDELGEEVLEVWAPIGARGWRVEISALGHRWACRSCQRRSAWHTRALAEEAGREHADYCHQRQMEGA